MVDGLVFGWRTAILTVVVLQLIAIAVALPRTLINRAANRMLAALLLTLAGVLIPWLIGFSGFYDRWPWLTFAPFAITLAIPPLLYAYVYALTKGRVPRHMRSHFAPAIAQLLFLFAGFLLPQPLKDRWSEIALGPFNRVAGVAAIIGLAIYGRASAHLLTDYRQRIAEQCSDDALYAGRWLSRALGATMLLLPIWAIYAIWDALSPLGYFTLMGLHIAIAIFALYFAIEGWRHAGLRFPTLDELVTLPEISSKRDWKSQGAAWAAQTRVEKWVVDPELSLAVLSRRLGTNTAYLSRALNEGLGIGFSAFVNGLRAELVAAEIDAGSERELLSLALDAGFASKASFNRAFLARYGMTPSAYRRRRAAQIINLQLEARI